MKKRALALLLAAALLLALAACDRGEEDDGPSWRSQYNLGLRYLENGNYEEAALAFQAAIDIDPQREDAYLALAEAYTALGQPDKAREVLREGLEATDSDEIAGELEKLDVPETPDTPDAPDAPDTPDTPDTPEAPETPGTPGVMPEGIPGMAYQEARKLLEDLGIPVTAAYTFRDAVPFDTVIDASAAPGETPGPQGVTLTVSNGSEADILAAVDEIYLGAMAYRFSDGGTRGSLSFDPGACVKADIDGDGRADIWCVGADDSGRDLVVLNGSYPDYGGLYFEYGNGRFAIYRSAQEPGFLIHFSNAYLNTGYLYDEFRLAGKAGFRQIAVREESDDAGVPPTVEVRDAQVTPEEFEAYERTATGVGAAPSTPYGDAFRFNTGLDNRLLGALGERLAALPCAGAQSGEDQNGDGIPDFSVSFPGLGGEKGPYVYYSIIDTNKMDPHASHQVKVLLQSSPEGVTAQILEGEGTDDRGSENGLADGEYQVTLRRDAIYDRPDGTYIQVDILEHISYSQQEVDALKPGDRLPGLSYTVEFIEYEDPELIYFTSDTSLYLIKLDGRWYPQRPNDTYFDRVTASPTLPVSPTGVFLDGKHYEEYDADVKPAHRVNSIRDLFASSYEESFEADITVERGQVVKAVIYFFS